MDRLDWPEEQGKRKLIVGLIILGLSAVIILVLGHASIPAH